MNKINLALTSGDEANVTQIHLTAAFENRDMAELALARLPYSDRQRFLYFCGICWRKIREENLEQTRAELIEENTERKDH